MKKFLIGLMLFLFSPMLVNAASVKVTDYLIDADILENGDLEVEEIIVAKGSFNYFERDILYKNDALQSGDSFANNKIYNASNIILDKINAKTIDKVSDELFNILSTESFIKTTFAQNGDKDKYTSSNITNGYRYRIYYKTNNDTTAFYIKYTVKDAVVMHEDVAELYWTFIPDGFEEDLNHIDIKVHLPKSDSSSNFKIWAHGNLSGEITKINDSSLKANIDEVLSGESVDIRLTFDKSLVTSVSSSKKSNVNALNKIIEVETARADVANKLREELKSKYDFCKYATITIYIMIVILGIWIYLKYGKSPKSGYYSKYNREFIDDYNVEVIDYLMNKRITPNAMSASIMNLIYKKNLSVKEISNDSKQKDYTFILENLENINESEQILIEFLFNKVGKSTLNEEGKKVFTTIDLKKYASGTKTCNTFISSYTKWKNDVLKKAHEEEFYETHSAPKFIGIFIILLSFIVFIYGMGNGVDYIPTYLLIFASIIFLIYCLLVDKKTIKGALHFDKWTAFKNFLRDFGSFKLKELPEIILWERYLVYATIFGLADKVEKSMNVHIKELELSDLDYDYYPSFFYLNLGHTINSSVNNALNSAYSRQAANYANSHSSSSSGGGFGGGFSSGGGFGGGGGGGRFG